MVKRKYQPKRKASSLPKGLPFRNNKSSKASQANNINPFENARASSSKQPKFHVHNRPTSGSTNNANKGKASALARSIENRRNGLKLALQQNKKAGAFIDRRIGESKKNEMTEDERMLARVIRERARRNKKTSKYALDDDDGGGNDGGGITLTHGGKVIDETYTGRLDAATDIILSDDDDDKQLDKVDTEMHFGGGAFDREKQRASNANPYGPSSGTGGEKSLGDVYRSRKEELDEMIMRKKWEKAEKAKSKEDQVEKFEGMDDQFKELASLLQFRDKEKERKEKAHARKAGTLTNEEKEMDEWDREMKQYLFERKVKATDRTKTPEEIAKEEAEKLHELETKRLARMNGDFDDDDLSDISDEEGTFDRKSRDKKANKKMKGTKKSVTRNPDELDSDEEDSKELEVRFTPDGLVYVDKEGNVVKKVSEDKNIVTSNYDDNDGEEDSIENQTPSDDETSSEITSDDNEIIGGSDDEASAADAHDDGESSASDSDLHTSILEVGTKVKGRYRAEEQFEGNASWYNGIISNVTINEKTGNVLYDLHYDDGDTEEGMKPENVKRLKKKKEDKKEEEKKAEMKKLRNKKLKAKEKARVEIPYVFEVPTTLEALHDMIGTYAATGSDACLIIQRIHGANSVRSNKNNKEKMQNFYDVLLRRFIGVGDALYKAGDGGEELSRYDQLDSLTKTLYNMSQDSPSCAGAVWGRRLGIFQKALAKRLRDSGFVGVYDEENFTAWPSTGILLLMRALGHIFPVSDLRHVVVTPALIFLGQTLAQAPVRSVEDITRGLFCAGLMIEYTKESKRIPSEALAFLAGVLRLFADDDGTDIFVERSIPSLEAASKLTGMNNLRQNVIDYFATNNLGEKDFSLSLENSKIQSFVTPSAILLSAIRLTQKSIDYYCGSINFAEREIFDQISRALLCLSSKSRNNQLPSLIVKVIAETASAISQGKHMIESRHPLLRRSAAKASELSIQSLAPRMEDPTRYAMTKDKDKTRMQAERDRLRREYKREQKAVSRELRLDAAFIESERRKEKEAKDSAARQKRHKNFAWLEQEQATMNQQVAQGGGLLKGGGVGAAKSKAASGKLGIKKGGKFR